MRYHRRESDKRRRRPLDLRGKGVICRQIVGTLTPTGVI